MKAVLIVPSGTSSRINGILIYRGEVELTASLLRFTIQSYLTDWDSEAGPEQSFMLRPGERIVVLSHVAQQFPGQECEIELIREEFFCSGEDRAVLIPEGLHLCFENGALTFSEDDPMLETPTANTLPVKQVMATVPMDDGIHCDGFCG